MIVEIVKATLEDTINAVLGAVEKGYKFVTAREVAGFHYVTLDAADVVKDVEAAADAPVVAQEPQKVEKVAEVVAEQPQTVEEEAAKPVAKRGKK